MMKGIDISEGCIGIRMADVKKDGNKFVILRAGYTGWGTGTRKVKDAAFESFYTAAKACGLAVGAYWYSCADSYEKGVAEAQWMYENCLKGKQFEMPIYIDIEERRWQLNKVQGVTQAIIGFCSTLEKLGCFAGVYALWSWFVDPSQIDTSKLAAYTKWVACVSKNKPTWTFNAFDMWQYTGDRPAYGAAVDDDEAYVDFPSIIKAAGLNGFTKPQSTGKGGKSEKTTNARDVTETMKHIVGKSTKGVDANKDGKINAKDVQKMMRDQVDRK